MNENKNSIILRKSNGKFIIAYGMDAIILNYLFGYKIVENKKVVFPNTSLDKVTNKLDELNISYQIISIDSNPIVKDFASNNKYKEIYNSSMEKISFNQKLDMIIEKIKEADSEKIDELIEVITKCLE
jgi:hypothetical protein